MSVPAHSTFCLIEFIDWLPLSTLVLSDDHLSNALSVIDDKIFLPKVDKNDADFIAIVAVDSARRITNADTMLQCKTAAWTYLCFISHR